MTNANGPHWSEIRRMKNARTRYALSLALTVSIAACGGPDAGSVTLGDTSAGSGGKSGSKADPADAGDAGSPDDGGVDASTPDVIGADNAAAPQIEFTAPTVATDPNTDELVTSKTVNVRCRVTKSPAAGARNVNQASVRIQLLAGQDAVDTKPVVGVVNALPDNEFEADFSLAMLPNGPLRFLCAADDIGMPVVTGSGTLDTFLDLGPEVAILDPKNGSSKRLLNIVTVTFEVHPAPVNASDKKAEPTDIKLTIQDREFTVAEDPIQAGLYTIPVDFNNRSFFAMAPSSAEIVVTALSSRTPNAPTRRVESNITLDAVGPTITVSAPGNGVIVRGIVPLKISVSDLSGVDPDSVVATIFGKAPFVIDDWNTNGAMYSQEFDTLASNFTDLTQLTINIVASDLVGNESTTETSVRLDNLSPLLSLDPPMVREYVMESVDTLRCSERFDPVGDDAINDGEQATLSSLYRVMVIDRTNQSPGQVTSYHADVDPTSVQLFAQPDPGTPLLIDTNSDGVCDEINFVALPQAQRPILRNLTSMTPRGSAYFSTTTDFSSDPLATAWGCVPGVATTPPSRVCLTTSLTRVIHGFISNDPPAIYSYMPTNTATGACAGDSWELLPIVGEGWACLAARAEDQIGNIGISPPIRVCFDDGDGVPLCDPETDTLPSCTDGCTLPPDFSSGMILRQ